MKNIKILSSLAALSVVTTIGVSLTSCNLFKKTTTEHIVQPSKEEKQLEPSVGALSATYNIALKETPSEAITATITNESIVGNASNFKTPVVNVTGKTCKVTVEWLNKPENDKTCSFSLQLKTSKWTSTITGCSLKYTSPIVTSLTVYGTHNVDNSTSGIKYTVKSQNGVNVTSDCTFTVVDVLDGTTNLGSIDPNTGTLTLIGKALTQNCRAKISATHTPSGKVGEFFIEIASFNKLLADGSTYSLQNHYATIKPSATGNVILPTQYYDETIKDWVETTTIASGGANDNVTWVYISATIEDIGSQCFGSGMTGFEVSGSNGVYSCPAGSNCIIKTADKELIAGCTNTVIPTNGNTVQTIGSNAFYRSQFTGISIPSNITAIKNHAFFKCNKLTSISIPSSITSIGVSAFEDCNLLDTATFADDTVKWIQSTDTTNKYMIDISTPSVNAINLRKTASGITGTNWATTGINTESSAIKMAKIVYDNTFNNKEVEKTSGPSIITTDSSTINIGYNYNEIDDAISSTGSIIGKNSKGETVFNATGITFDRLPATSPVSIDVSSYWNDIAPQDTLTLTFAPKTYKITKFENNITGATVTIDETSTTKQVWDTATKRDITVKYALSGVTSLNARVSLVNANSEVVYYWDPRLDKGESKEYKLSHSQVFSKVVDGGEYTLRFENKP